MNMQTKILLLTCCFLSNAVFAQSDSSNPKNLSEVIVTGQFRPQTIKNSVYQVRVISARQIQEQGAANLQDVLNKLLNVRFSQDLATGGTNLKMMGLSGQNVKVLIDGVPVVGRQGTNNEFNINQFDINSLEKIELVEGPMSVVYGADALAGVINLITKKSGKQKISVTARIQEETVGKEYGIKEGIHNQYLSANYNYKNWYVRGSLGRNLFQGWKDTAIGRELIWHKKDQILGNAILGFQNNKLHAYYRFDGLDEIITNPSNPVNTQPGLDQDYISDRAMHQLQGTYTFNNKLTANALASYTHFTRQVYSTLYFPNGDVRASTAPGTQTFNTFNGATFRTTVLYTASQKLSFQPGVDINLETGSGDRMESGTKKIGDYAFFISSEYKPWSWLNIRPGLRFIENSVYDAPPVIPSLNTKIILTKNLDLRLAYARGFRAPTLRELYYNFIDASHTIVGNPDLQAEQSNSFTGSLHYSKILPHNIVFNTSISGFFNDVDNMIDYAAKDNMPTFTTYMNVEKTKTVGGTWQGDITYKNLQVGIGYSYTGRYNQYRANDKTLPSYKFTSEFNGTAQYHFKKIGLDAGLFYKYTGKLPFYQSQTVNGSPAIVLAQNGSYHIADVNINKKICKQFQINTGVRNLFDVTNITNSSAVGGVHSNGGSTPIGYGRSYFLGLTYQWNK